MRIILIVLSLLIPFPVLLAHRGQSIRDDTYTLEQLSSDIYLLKGGRGGNVAFRVGQRGVVIIDNQFADLAPEIKKSIRKVTDKPIRYLINTHHHEDHIGGNSFFLENTEIVAHENVRRNLIELRAEDVKIADLGTPTLTYHREIRLYLDDSEIQVFHLDRAHTSGDSVVYFPEQKIAHMGDLHFNGLHPFIDVEGGASSEGWINFLEGVLERVAPETLFIPGHGDITTIDGVKLFITYLQELRAKVKRAIAVGKTRQETLETVVIETSQHWPPERLEDNIGIVYDELREESWKVAVPRPTSSSKIRLRLDF